MYAVGRPYCAAKAFLQMLWWISLLEKLCEPETNSSCSFESNFEINDSTSHFIIFMMLTKLKLEKDYKSTL
jgi:hypothetical protein